MLTQSSKLDINNNTQRFPLYHGEASSSQTSMLPQNYHEHCSVSMTSNQSCPSHSASLLFVQDLVVAESTSFNHDLRSSINDEQTIGQVSYQRKRPSLLRTSFAYFGFVYKFFPMYLLPQFTLNFYSQESRMSTMILGTKHSNVVIARHFFGLTSVSHIQLNPVQDSLFVVLVAKLCFHNQF